MIVKNAEKSTEQASVVLMEILALLNSNGKMWSWSIATNSWRCPNERFQPVVWPASSLSVGWGGVQIKLASGSRNKWCLDLGTTGGLIPDQMGHLFLSFGGLSPKD